MKIRIELTKSQLEYLLKGWPLAQDDIWITCSDVPMPDLFPEVAAKKEAM